MPATHTRTHKHRKPPGGGSELEHCWNSSRLDPKPPFLCSSWRFCTIKANVYCSPLHCCWMKTVEHPAGGVSLWSLLFSTRLLCSFSWRKTPVVRNKYHCGKKLLTEIKVLILLLLQPLPVNEDGNGARRPFTNGGAWWCTISDWTKTHKHSLTSDSWVQCWVELAFIPVPNESSVVTGINRLQLSSSGSDGNKATGQTR